MVGRLSRAQSCFAWRFQKIADIARQEKQLAPCLSPRGKSVYRSIPAAFWPPTRSPCSTCWAKIPADSINLEFQFEGESRIHPRAFVEDLSADCCLLFVGNRRDQLKFNFKRKRGFILMLTCYHVATAKRLRTSNCNKSSAPHFCSCAEDLSADRCLCLLATRDHLVQLITSIRGATEDASSCLPLSSRCQPQCGSTSCPK